MEAPEGELYREPALGTHATLPAASLPSQGRWGPEAEWWAWQPGAPVCAKHLQGRRCTSHPGDTCQGCLLEAKAQGLGPRARKGKAGFPGASRRPDKVCGLWQRRRVVKTHLANSSVELAGPAPAPGR